MQQISNENNQNNILGM